MDDAHAYCPHCRQLLLEQAPFPFPNRPVRCSGCRLLVGPGRARDVRGRARRAPQTAGPRVGTSGAGPSSDAVLDVLRDLQDQSSDVQLQAAVASLAPR